MPFELQGPRGKPVQTEGLGELTMFYLTMRDEESRTQEVANSNAQERPEEIVRILVRHVFHQKVALTKGLLKPDSPTLTADDVARLTTTDLENLARAYLDDNPDLYKRLVHETPSEDGNSVSSSKLGDEIEHPRKEQESEVVYLARLLKIREQEWERLVSRTMQNAQRFAKPIQREIANLQRAGEALRGSFRFPVTDLLKQGSMPEFTRLTPRQDPAVETNRLLKNLSDDIQELVGVVGRTGDYAVLSNEVQVGIAGDIRQAVGEGKTSTKINVGLSVVVIVLSGLSLGIGVYSAIVAPRDASRAQEVQFQQLQEQLTEIADLERRQLDALTAALHRPPSSSIVDTTAVPDASSDSTKSTP